MPTVWSLLVMVNGLVQVSGYAVSGSTITFDADATPVAGDHVFAVYRY